MSEPIFIPNVRAIKGFAPTASQFNQLANNLEFLNTRKIPRTCVLRLASNTALAISGATGLATLSFDTSVLDTDTMFSGGILTAPTDAKFMRIAFNIAFSSLAERNFVAYTQIFNHDVFLSHVVQFELGFQIRKKTGGTWNGVQAFNYDSGWVQYDSSVAHCERVVFSADPAVTFTVNSDNATWLSLEVI